MIGQTLGHFEILEKIGEGGMGVVYKAHDTHLDRLVAIKILPPDTVANPVRRRRFAQEARTASALNHSGIVTIYDITEDNGVDFIAMEFLPGHTLDRLIPPHGLGLKEVLDYGVQIADALAAAHAAGIVHRDVKPANVIVTEHGQVKVLDFGLAKLFDSGLVMRNVGTTVTEPSPLTERGAIAGTVAYMAPEQAENKTLDVRSDIFSLGCVLYEMVTGRRAFQGDSRLAILTAILREEPTPISSVTNSLPPELERIVTRCLRKDPARRWQSMADVKVALRELQDESGGRLLPVLSGGTNHAWRTWAGVALISLIGVALMVALWWQGRAAASNNVPASFDPIPLTTDRGREQQPSFSPDGNSFAFTWNGETEENWDIYVKLIGEGTSQRLTTDPAVDTSPAWSPDGRSIAFLRASRGHFRVMVVPSRGGPEREVYAPHWIGDFGVGQLLTWSSDSRFLVLGASSTDQGPLALTVVDLTTLATRRLLSPPASGTGDSLPAISPDGKALAFVRHTGARTGELFVQSMSAGLMASGEPTRLSGEQRFYHGLAWSADNHDLIVSMGNADIGLWRISLRDPEHPIRLSPPGDECRQPAIAAQPPRLAFTRASTDENIWRQALSAPGRSDGSAISLTGSTRAESNAQFSPDGNRIVLESLRSGTQELWISDADGRNAQRLTSFNGRRGGTPAWSRDGQIAFDLRNADGLGDIYVISERGGTPVQMTTHPADDLVPSWSHDGRWIYFGSRRTGEYQIWKMPAQGGEPTQVTRNRGTYAKEDVDGRYIYYAKLESFFSPTLWRVPVSGGEEIQVLQNLASYTNFAVAKDGIYFESSSEEDPLGHFPMLTPFTRPQATIDFFSFSTGQVTRVLTLNHHAGHGLDVSPDGRRLLFGQVDSFTEDLMLVEKFR